MIILYRLCSRPASAQPFWGDSLPSFSAFRVARMYFVMPSEEGGSGIG
jgi:hypothetical protein